VAGNVVEFDGNLGLVIGAGGGSLTLFDAVRKHGGRPANYCEIGGNPSVTKVCELTSLPDNALNKFWPPDYDRLLGPLLSDPEAELEEILGLPAGAEVAAGGGGELGHAR